jgi:hypothetical protein
MYHHVQQLEYVHYFHTIYLCDQDGNKRQAILSKVMKLGVQ